MSLPMIKVSFAQSRHAFTSNGVALVLGSRFALDGPGSTSDRSHALGVVGSELG